MDVQSLYFSSPVPHRFTKISSSDSLVIVWNADRPFNLKIELIHTTLELTILLHNVSFKIIYSG